MFIYIASLGVESIDQNFIVLSGSSSFHSAGCVCTAIIQQSNASAIISSKQIGRRRCRNPNKQTPARPAGFLWCRQELGQRRYEGWNSVCRHEKMTRYCFPWRGQTNKQTWWKQQLHCWKKLWFYGPFFRFRGRHKAINFRARPSDRPDVLKKYLCKTFLFLAWAVNQKCAAAGYLAQRFLCYRPWIISDRINHVRKGQPVLWNAVNKQPMQVFYWYFFIVYLLKFYWLLNVFCFCLQSQIPGAGTREPLSAAHEVENILKVSYILVMLNHHFHRYFRKKQRVIFVCGSVCFC